MLIIPALACFTVAFFISRARLARLTQEARFFRVLGTESGRILWDGFPR